MHAIVMVHKMQSMTLSNHQLLPNKHSETPSRPTGAMARVPVQHILKIYRGQGRGESPLPPCPG